ncbi:cadherin-related family member 3 [Prionailurus iriomotensis]
MGTEALRLIHLPATSNVAENSPPETSVHKFSVNLSASLAPVTPGFPLIINSSPLTDAFKVNWLSGTDFEVVTSGKEQLDFEMEPNIFELQIYVKDDVGVTDLQILTVQVTDVNEPPEFQGNLAKGLDLYIVEAANPGFIYQVEAFDPEDTNRSIPLSYFLISPSVNFRLSASGTLFSTTEFDFEAGHRRDIVRDSRDPVCNMADVSSPQGIRTMGFYLTAGVRDSQGLQASTTLHVNIVNINDEVPRFTSPARVYSIPEELDAGTIVANITAEDPDDKGSTGFLLYSITTANSYFVINQLTGIMVPERAAKGTSLLDLNKFCSDDDSEAPNNRFNFSSPSGVGVSGRFSQDPAGSGKIVLIGDLDYENTSNLAAGNTYAVIIQVQDVAPPYHKSKNNIYIYILTEPENEFPLVFDSPSYVFDVSELRPARTRVGQVHATDKDLPRSRVMYSISAGGASFQSPNIFWINPRTGELQLVTKADYETTPVYILRIQATSSEDTSSVTVTVNVLEENDEKPICTPNSYFLAIPVGLRVGTNIQNFKLTCTDLDSSPRSFRYSIGSGNVNSHFTFSPSAGSNVTSLLLATRFDYASGLDKIWDYKLLVHITDGNLLSGRRKAKARVETGTVMLSISVIPDPTTIATTTSRVIRQVLRKNVYSSSAWYVPFIITLGSMLLLGLLVFLFVQLVKAIHRHCPCKAGKYQKTLVKKGEMKNTKRGVLVETIQMNSVFDGEAIDPALLGQYMNSTQKLEPESGKIPQSKCQDGKSPAPTELLQVDLSQGKGPGHSGAPASKMG